MRRSTAALCCLAVAAQQHYRYDFALDGSPLSIKYDQHQDLWRNAAEFVGGRGWALADDARACRDAATSTERDSCAVRAPGRQPKPSRCIARSSRGGSRHRRGARRG